ncbi:MAG: alpha/beta fold hydrolase [Pseudomonadota bacterium]
MQRVTVPLADGHLVVDAWHWDEPERPAMLLIPSLGRGAADFADVCALLAAEGLRCLAMNPRGIADSSPVVEGATLFDYARDAVSVIDAASAPTAHVVGHAFGNRIARCVASRWGQRVDSVVLLAAGGGFPPEEDARLAMLKLLGSDSLSEAEIDACLSNALFAPGSNPAPWRDGWYRRTAGRQIAAAKATDTGQWWHGGSAPLLVVQALADRMALSENGRKLVAERANSELVEIAAAGHAMLPEVPGEVAARIASFVKRNLPP